MRRMAREKEIDFLVHSFLYLSMFDTINYLFYLSFTIREIRLLKDMNRIHHRSFSRYLIFSRIIPNV